MTTGETGTPVGMRVLLSMLWVAVMLTYLLGDVLRVYSGDYTPGEFGLMEPSQGLWLGIAVLMSIPIAVVALSLLLPAGATRWLNVAVAAFFFLFNLVGLPTYESYWDQYLIVVGLVFTFAIGWYAWQWDPAVGSSVGG